MRKLLGRLHFSAAWIVKEYLLAGAGFVPQSDGSYWGVVDVYCLDCECQPYLIVAYVKLIVGFLLCVLTVEGTEHLAFLESLCLFEPVADLI